MGYLAKSICFEGGEGSGKGTVIKSLIERLTKMGYNVISTREPGGTRIGEQIREVILNKANTEMTGLTEAMLFASSRSQIVSEIVLPNLSNENTIIILDRYVYSAYVYQGIVRGVGYDTVRKINEIATLGWYPDLAIYLDLDPEVGLKRIASNNRDTNRLDLENLDFHKSVREGYLKVSNDLKNFKVVNADNTPENVLNDVINLLKHEQVIS